MANCHLSESDEAVLSREMIEIIKENNLMETLKKRMEQKGIKIEGMEFFGAFCG
jgi:hypothetical protein